MTSLTALLDLRMPELDGVGAIKEIRELDDNAQIVVLTTFDGLRTSIAPSKQARKHIC